MSALQFFLIGITILSTSYLKGQNNIEPILPKTRIPYKGEELLGEINILIKPMVNCKCVLHYNIHLYDNVEDPGENFKKIDNPIEESKKNWYKLTNLGSTVSSSSSFVANGKEIKTSVTPKIDSIKRVYLNNKLFYKVSYSCVFTLESSDSNALDYEAIFEDKFLEEIGKSNILNFLDGNRKMVLLLKNVEIFSE